MFVRSISLLTLAACSNFTVQSDLEVADGASRQMCDIHTVSQEGAFAEWGSIVGGERAACHTANHAIGGPAGAVLEVELLGFEGGAAWIEQWDWNGAPIATWGPVEAGQTVRIGVPWSGEHQLRVVPVEDMDSGGEYGLRATCAEGCSDEWTRHPILLMHGMGAPIPGAANFHNIEETLFDQGYSVWEPEVALWNDTELRANEWRTHLDAWRASGTWRRVHLVGHSMGGIDARYLATFLDPEAQIATITTIGTPHRGSEVADMVMEYSDPDAITSDALQDFVEWLGPVMGADSQQDLDAQMTNLSTAGMATFNANVPDRPDVTYRSWAGATCAWTDWACQDQLNGETVDADMSATFFLMPDVPNDGVVRVESAIWGEFQGVLGADHLDLNGRMFPGWAFDPYGFYVREAQRLAAWERGEQGPSEPQAIDLGDVL